MSESEQVQGLLEQIKRLLAEHRSYASELERLRGEARTGVATISLRDHFTALQDSLTEHMLTEEFEIYPEVMKRDLFDSSISSIMQQHHDVTSCLGKMELSLRLGRAEEFLSAMEELVGVLCSHQPAEEEHVFPLITS